MYCVESLALAEDPQTAAAPSQANSVATAFEAHKTRQQGLVLCRLLIDLMLEIQKHRGCTLAVLSGDHFFEMPLLSIQRDITEHFQRFESERREFLSLTEAQQILQEWVCIRRLWRKDSVAQNFLLHSNLLAELLKLLWLVAQRSGQLGVSERQDELTTLCLRDWPEMIETAAQTRGLATHVAVSGEIEPEILSRVRYLAEQLNLLDTRLNDRIQQLDKEALRAIQVRVESTEYTSHLANFQNSLSLEILNERSAHNKAVDPDHIYTLGSQVVSASHQCLLTGLRLIERALSPELAQWVFR